MIISPRILIITNGPLSRNPRVWKEAKTLSEAGMNVHVLGVRHRADSEASDRDLMDQARFTRSLVNTGTADSDRLRSFWRRLRTRIGGELVQRAGCHSAWALPASAALLSHAQAIPADLTIVHNEAPQWVGCQLIKEGRKVAADIEDWHSEDLLPEHRSRRPLRLLRKQEHFLLHHAHYCTTTSHALAEALHQCYGGKKPQVVTNSFPLQPDPLARPTPDAPALYWFSQTVGPGRGLELFLAAWGLTRRPSRLVLQGECAPTFQHHLRSLLPASMHASLEFLPLVDPQQLAASIAQHDIGLALEQPFILNRDLTITNKILQYLNAGLAVLASDTRGQREVLGQSPDAGTLFPLHHTTTLTGIIDDWLGDPAALDRRRRSARLLAEKTYCWEQEASKLVDRVLRALHS